MKVYTVYYYAYDYSRIRGIFSSHEKAQEYVDQQLPEGDRVNYEIEEWEVDVSTRTWCINSIT